MKKIKSIILSSLLLVSSGTMVTSCSDWLELEPIDNYGSGSYWKTEAQATGYIDGIHKHLRDAAWQHTIVWGELRGGIYKDGVGSDGFTLSEGNIRLQNFDKNNTGVTGFGNTFGRITNLNLFIARITDATYLSEQKKNFYLAQVYGLRAFYYFDLYRIYGGVPLRLTVDVIDGELDPNKLYMKRSTPKEVMTQIKSDLDKSMEYFGNVNDFDPYGRGKKVYWSKAATECLMGEVYLWTSKVTTGDNMANVADLTVAKEHLLNVVNNYGLKLLDNFADVFDAQNHKGNDEVIFAIRYAEGEASNNNAQYTYKMSSGQTSKSKYRADGTIWGDPMGLQDSGSQWYEYNLLLYKAFDEEDTRRDATFMASYNNNSDGLSLFGTYVCKNIGYLNAQGTRVYCGDYVFYRLPWVYLTLAEIANMESDNANVKKYINLVRERAYADNWDEGKYGYVPGDFTANELAILHEKDKEFVQEGQRWWDVCRMTLTKSGKHLVFCKEASLDGQNPILNEAEAYKILWPIEQTMLDKDPALEQTPGYKEAEKKE